MRIGIYNFSAQVSLWVGISLLPGCSALKTPEASVLELAQDSVVTIANGDTALFNKGARVPLNSPTYVESPGHASMLIVPGPTQPANIVVNLKPLTPQGARGPNGAMMIDLNAFLLETGEIQDLFEANKYLEALARLDELIPKYQSASQLQLWRAVLLKTLARPVEALSAIDKILQTDPNHPQAKHLFNEWTREYQRQ